MQNQNQIHDCTDHHCICFPIHLDTAETCTWCQWDGKTPKDPLWRPPTKPELEKLNPGSTVWIMEF